MRILIIGSEGFIGSNCVKYFTHKGYTIWGVDLFNQSTQLYNYRKISRLSDDLEEIINFDFKKCTEYYGCEKDITSKEQYKFIKLPYRRNSIFKKLKHDENGFVGDNWKSKNTRVNQIKYSNS